MQQRFNKIHVLTIYFGMSTIKKLGWEFPGGLAS